MWHLHLLYTRDYWGVFCGRTLGVPLHHGPTRGGTAEGDKFSDWYARTLASYRRFFGEPPADLWPERPMHPQTVRVDVARHWIVAKPNPRAWVRRVVEYWIRSSDGKPQQAGGAGATLRSARATRAGLVLAAVGPLTDRAEAATPLALVWPFDLPGPQFLGVFALFAVFVFAAALLRRWQLRLPAEGAPDQRLDAYETAALAGGPGRVFFAAVTASAQRGLVELKRGKLVRTAVPLPADLALSERVICEAARADGSELKHVRSAAGDVLKSIGEGLAEKGLLMHGTNLSAARWTPFLMAMTVPIAGLIKIGVGFEREKPVAFLVILSMLAFGAALAFLRAPRRSRLGSRTLDRLQVEHGHLHTLRSTAVAGGDGPWLVPLAVGLWGASALHGTPLAPLGEELRRQPAGDSGGGAGVCGAGDSGGGGGCGGGGCGGCGGGGD